MKKAIAILLVLLVAGAAFGGTFDSYTNDADASLVLQTTVAGRYGVKVSDAALTSETLGALITEFLGVTSITDPVIFSEDAPSDTLYVHYMTNQKIQAVVDVDADPLASGTAGIDTKIGYTVTVDGTPTEVASTASAVNIKFIEEAGVTNGMRVASKAFTIAMDTDDFLAATAASDYETTWTINLTTN